MKKQIIIDYDEYLELERNNEAHKENIKILEGKVIVECEYYDNLQQELTDYKEICKLALEYIEKNKFDYEVKEKGFYMIQGVVPEFRLRELLKGQLTIEGMKNLLDKKDKE